MRLPRPKNSELRSLLEKEGFRATRQTGSHRFYRHEDGRTTVVPIHANEEIGIGLLIAILKDVKMSRREFLQKYKRI